MIQLRAGGEQVSTNWALLPEDRQRLSISARDGASNHDAPVGQRGVLPFLHPRSQHEVRLGLKADDPPSRPIGERLGHVELIGNGGDILVGGHARQGRARLVTSHGRPEHEEAFLLDMVQAARRVDDEVRAEPALSEAELRAHCTDEDEPTEHAGCLREREDGDNEGTDGMRADGHEGNATQVQRVTHRIPSPPPSTLIHNAGRTPYCRSTFAPLSEGTPDASTNCVAKP